VDTLGIVPGKLDADLRVDPVVSLDLAALDALDA
jgi:hypothetical protein